MISIVFSLYVFSFLQLNIEKQPFPAPCENALNVDSTHCVSMMDISFLAAQNLVSIQKIQQNVNGQISLIFTVQKNGSVNNVTIESNETADTTISAKIIELISKWKFTEFLSLERSEQLSYTFKFPPNNDTGKIRTFHDNGNIAEAYTLSDSFALTGQYESWYEGGEKAIVANFEGGKLIDLYRRYFRNGIVSVEGQFLNGYKEGDWNCNYENGNKAETIRYSAGKIDGQNISYYENGQPKIECTWKNGQLDGVWISRAENGRILLQGKYNAGKKEGLWESWYDNGSIKSRVIYKNGLLDDVCQWWYENRNLWQESEYKNGEKNGLQLVFDSLSGKKIGEYSYENDFLDGSFKEWYGNGQIKIAADYSNGKADGKYRRWSSKGDLMLECTFDDGNESGRFVIYYEDGSKAIEGKMKNGKKHGSYKEWDERGNLVTEQLFNNGILVEDSD